ERLRAVPDVRGVSLSGSTPLGSENALVVPEVAVAGYVPRAGEDMRVRLMQIYPGYFSTLAIPLLAGRDLVDADNDANASRKAVVNELMARRFFGTAQAAVGGRFALINGAAFEIVGVAANTRDRAIREEPSPLA